MTGNPSTQILKALFYILDQVKGANKRFTFYYNETRYVVDIKKFKKKRSIDQNSVLHMWFTYLENQTGQPRNDLYRFFENKFSELQVKHINGFGSFVLPKPVKTFNTSEFSEYMQKVKVDILEQTGCDLPFPGEPEWENFYLTYNDK